MTPEHESGGPLEQGPAAEKIRFRQDTDQPLQDSGRDGHLDNLGAAVEYAESGVPVLPLHWPQDPHGCSCGRATCPTPAKHPLGALVFRGHRDATTDPDRVRAWWRQFPNANVGIRPAPGTFVLDVDPRNGGGDTLWRLQDEHGALPETLTAATGSGGFHIVLAGRGPFHKRLDEGIDVKVGATGYIVAAPSRHVSGGRYRWVDENVRVAPAPAWVLARARPRSFAHPVAGRTPPGLLRSAGASAKRAAGLIRAVTNAPAGRRNDVLFWAACRAHECGGDTILLDDLRTAAASNGLSSLEVENTLKSAACTSSPREASA